MGSMSNAFSRKFASKLDMHLVTVSMSMSYLSSDDSSFVWFATRRHCIVVCLVHLSTTLA